MTEPISTELVFADETGELFTATDNPDWSGTVEVDEAVFERCSLRSMWTDCANEVHCP